MWRNIVSRYVTMTEKKKQNMGEGERKKERKRKMERGDGQTVEEEGLGRCGEGVSKMGWWWGF